MIRKLFLFIFKLFLWFFIFSTLLVLLYKWVPVPLTPLMVIRSIQQKQESKDIVWKHDWIPIEDMPESLQLAVVCSEDQNFLSHKGFDMKAIEKAIEHNKKGAKLKGASTISQQTAKNVFLWPHRSWFRKGLEAYFTFLIELIWTKERIMEVYLNSIEMGNGIYGAEAASKYWFNKSASKLLPSESAAIAAILPKPLSYKATPPSTYIQSRISWILKQMSYHGKLEY